MQNRSIDSPTDFNFKRRAKKISQAQIEQTKNWDERGSIFLSQIPHTSTQHSSILEHTAQDSVQQKADFSQDFTKSINVTSILVQHEIPKNVQTKCRTLIQKKINEKRPNQPQLLKQLLNKPRKGLEENNQAQKLIYREERLKRRAVKERPTSALARTQIITSNLVKQGFDLAPYE